MAARLEMDLEPTDEELLATRPHCRGDCVDGPRPCPWVGCRHNTFLHITNFGRLRLTHGRKLGPLDVPAGTSCALDLVDRHGAMTLEAAGAVFGLTRERVRQLESQALDALHDDSAYAEHHDDPAEERPGAKSAGGKARAAESRGAVYAAAERTGRCQFPGCSSPPRARKTAKSRPPAYCSEHRDQGVRRRLLRTLR